ncbi:MAG: Gfo/Idh/MocA family oxidoreductase [bacterium]
MSSDKIKVAVIGCGGIADAMHFPSLKRMEGVEISAVCDISEKRLDLIKEKYGITTRYKDYKQMLDEVEADAVYYLALPPATEKIVSECMNRGKHVLLEKPPGVKLEETQRMAALAKKKGIKTLIGFNRRYSPVIRKAMEKIKSQGNVSSCLAEFHKNNIGVTEGYGFGGPWLAMDVIHQVDTLLYMGGAKVKNVKAKVDSYHAPESNYHSALVEFENGVNGIILSNFSSGTRYERFEIHGKGCAAYIRLPQEAEMYIDKKSETIKIADLTSDTESFATYGYLSQSEHFMDCIRNNKLPETNLDHGVEVMKLVKTILGNDRV